MDVQLERNRRDVYIEDSIDQIVRDQSRREQIGVLRGIAPAMGVSGENVPRIGDEGAREYG